MRAATCARWRSLPTRIWRSRDGGRLCARLSSGMVRRFLKTKVFGKQPALQSCRSCMPSCCRYCARPNLLAKPLRTKCGGVRRENSKSHRKASSARSSTARHPTARRTAIERRLILHEQLAAEFAISCFSSSLSVQKHEQLIYASSTSHSVYAHASAR